MNPSRHELGQMMSYGDGLWSHCGAEVEEWSAVLAEAADVEHIGPLTGWGEWTDAYCIYMPSGDRLTYFAA